MKTTLIDWVARGITPVAELIAPKDEDEKHMLIYIVRTGVGAEHFFAIVEFDTNGKTKPYFSYVSDSALYDIYGQDATVKWVQ